MLLKLLLACVLLLVRHQQCKCSAHHKVTMNAPASRLPLVQLDCCDQAWVPWCINRWRFRHIPGPFAPPVIGNLVGIGRMNMAGYLEHCRQRYGHIFKIYIGSNMLVCVADPVVAKRMLGKLSFRHAGIQLLAGPQDWDFLLDGLVGANGSAWHTLRSAWQPAFSPTALSSYLPAIHSAADALLYRLRGPAHSGEEVELAGLLTQLTMDVVGQAAYGVDLHKWDLRLKQQQHHQQQEQQQGRANATNNSSDSSSSDSSGGLLASMQAVFDGGGVANSSNYMALVLMFPALTRLWQWLAFNWPDRKLRALAKARSYMRHASLQLLHTWRPPPPPQAQHTTAALGTTTTPEATPPLAATSTDKQPLSTPGAFPATLLEARDKQTGQALSDEQVVAQLNSFLLAAFESTAAAITFCVYFIAQHPEAEARLVQEVGAAAAVANKSKDLSQLDLTQLPFTEAVVKEALRLLPPGDIATRSTEQSGLQLTPEVWLPPHTALFACIYCFHRDPHFWPFALDFKPERWLQEGAHLQPSTPDAYLPFGGGGRLCVGRQFATQAVVATIARLYQRYSFELLLPGQVPLALKQTFALVPAKGLRVRVFERAQR